MTGSTNQADAQTSNTSTRLWFYYVITKIHPSFQNPGSVPDLERFVFGEGEIGEPRENPLGARQRTNNKLVPFHFIPKA